MYVVDFILRDFVMESVFIVDFILHDFVMESVKRKCKMYEIISCACLVKSGEAKIQCLFFKYQLAVTDVCSQKA